MNYEGKVVMSRSNFDRRVYLVENGEKKWILSPTEFQKLGFKVNDILRVSDEELKSIPTSAVTLPAIEDGKRGELSRKYISGCGVEIGALHNPLPVDGAVKVRYVDLFSREENMNMYPGFEAGRIVRVDIIDDGEKLGKIEDGSQDFIIANHFLEHCKNPLGTIRTHLQKVRKDGILYYCVPNKDYTFDKERPLTTFEHLIKDDGGAEEHLDHYKDFVHFVSNKYGEEAKKDVEILVQMDNRTHFHVWDAHTLKDFFTRAQQYLDYFFKVEHFEIGGECIVISRKVV